MRGSNSRHLRCKRERNLPNLLFTKEIRFPVTQATNPLFDKEIGHIGKQFWTRIAPGGI